MNAGATGNVVLIDTSVWIRVLRKDASLPLKARVQDLIGDGRIAIIPLIAMELLGGINSQSEYLRLKSRLDSLQKIHLTEKDWEIAAFNAFKLRRKGIIAPYIDIIISTAASLYNLPLLHADRHYDLLAREFNLVAENILE